MQIFKGLAGGSFTNDPQVAVVLFDSIADIYLLVDMGSGALTQLDPASIDLLKVGSMDRPTKSLAWLLANLGSKSSDRFLVGLAKGYYKERSVEPLPPFFFTEKIEWTE
jgi:hypothetical protein